MLPAEGWLTERLVGLREKAYRMRQGHVARIEEIAALTRGLPPIAKRQLSEQLQAQYPELGLDLRLERLDGAAAEIERRIRSLTQEAERCAASYDFQRLHDALKAAEKLQKQNSSLFQTIERTEKKLDAAVRKAAREFRGVRSV